MRAVSGGTTAGSCLCHQVIVIGRVVWRGPARMLCASKKNARFTATMEKYGLIEGTDRESVSLSAQKSITMLCWDKTGTTVSAGSAIHSLVLNDMCRTKWAMRTYTVSSLVCEQQVREPLCFRSWHHLERTVKSIRNLLVLRLFASFRTTPRHSTETQRNRSTESEREIKRRMGEAFSICAFVFFVASV